MRKDGVEVGEASPSVTIKGKHLLEITAKVDAVDKSDGELTYLSLFVLNASGASRKKSDSSS